MVSHDPPHDATDPPPLGHADLLALLLASRRDALLLLLLGGAVVAGAWGYGSAAALGGAGVTAALWLLQLPLFLQGRWAARWLRGSLVGTMDEWSWGGYLVLGTLPATLLVARAAWLGLASWRMAALLAFLTLGWQLWLSFWLAERATRHRVEGP